MSFKASLSMAQRMSGHRRSHQQDSLPTPLQLMVWVIVAILAMSLPLIITATTFAISTEETSVKHDTAELQMDTVLPPAEMSPLPPSNVNERASLHDDVEVTTTIQPLTNPATVESASKVSNVAHIKHMEEDGVDSAIIQSSHINKPRVASIHINHPTDLPTVSHGEGSEGNGQDNHTVPGEEKGASTTGRKPSKSRPIMRFLFISIPLFFIRVLSTTITATVTLDFWSISILTTGIIALGWYITRYWFLNRYTRLPDTPKSHKPRVPFDLHPDAALDAFDTSINSYPDEFMGAFLSSIKVFGYLDRPVFHELARHLQTRKLKAGEILFRTEDEEHDFYVVVDGMIQIFVKGQSERQDGEDLALPDESDGADPSASRREWLGHHLLNEVKQGGTVSSLFSILAIFTQDTELPLSFKELADLTAREMAAAEAARKEAEDRENHTPRMPASLNLDGFDENLEDLTFSFDGSTLQTNHRKDAVFPSLTSSPSFGAASLKSVTSDQPTADKPNISIPNSNSKSKPPKKAYPSVHPDIVARAAKDTTLVVIPAAAFSKLTEKFPNAAAHIVQVILTRFQRVTFLTLYRYLGMSKELLKIEKAVNEFSGYGLPDGFFAAEDLERLRNVSMVLKSELLQRRISEDVKMKKKPAKSPISRPLVATPVMSVATLPGFEVNTVPGEPVRHSPVAFIIPRSERFQSSADSRSRSRSNTRVSSSLPRPASPEFPRQSLEYDRPIREAVVKCMSQMIGLSLNPLSAISNKMTASPSFSSATPASEGTPVFPLRRASSHRLPSELETDSHISSETSPISSQDSFIPILTHPGPPSTAADDIQLMFFERGTVLVREGEHKPGLFFVIDGILEACMNPSKGAGGSLAKSSLYFLNPNASASVTAAEEGVGSGEVKRKRLFLIRPGGLAGYLAALTGHPSFVTISAKTDSHVGYLPKIVLDKYVERHPNILLTLAKRLVTQLSPLVLHIDVALDWDQVNAGQVLCRQGDPSESIYIVLNGRLRSIAERPGIKTGTYEQPVSKGGNSSATDEPPTYQILAEYGQGESVGELEVLTDAQRPGTIHAIRDTEIAIMPKTLFNALALRHPEITMSISRIIVGRAQREPRVSVPMSFGSVTSSGGNGVDSGKNNVNLKTVAILPMSNSIPLEEFANNLKHALHMIHATVAHLNIAAVMKKLGRHAFSRLGRLKLMNWLAEQEDSHRIVLYVADGGVNSPWTQRCIRQADCILLIALADDDPEIGEYERLLIGMKTTARKELVLLHNERYCPAGSTTQWLKARLWIHAHHHIQMRYSSKALSAHHRIGNMMRLNTIDNIRTKFQKYYTRASALGGVLGGLSGTSSLMSSGGLRGDFARLARRLLSKSIALVLGGGGARGISHIGIIRALEEAGIPIDMVGGTSIGAFVGGLYSRENDHVSIYGRAKAFAGRMTSKWRQLFDLTYPVTSLFAGHEFNRGIWKCFLEAQIEDCWLSYFAVTTNITWSRMEIHQSGYLWRYVRASMSLSGYLPPLCDNGNLLLDGGYLNNLPVDIMKHHLGADTIIAIDVANVDSTSPVHYGDSLSGWWVLFNRLIAPINPFGSRYGNIPQIADIQSRLAYVSSVKQLEEAKRTPGCIYLHPPVSAFGVLQFESFKEIYQIGYLYGRQVVAEWEKNESLMRDCFGMTSPRYGGGSSMSPSTVTARLMDQQPGLASRLMMLGEGGASNTINGLGGAGAGGMSGHGGGGIGISAASSFLSSAEMLLAGGGHGVTTMTGQADSSGAAGSSAHSRRASI